MGGGGPFGDRTGPAQVGPVRGRSEEAAGLISVPLPLCPPHRKPGSGSSSTTCRRAPQRECTPQAIQSTFHWGNSIITEHIPTTG